MIRALNLLAAVVLTASCLAPTACAAPPVEKPPAQPGTAEAPSDEVAAPAVPARFEPADLLPNGRMPFEGVLTGGQPSAGQLATLRDLGYTTIVNLRLPDEQGSTQAAAVESLGMTYVSIPVDGAEGITEDSARRLAEVLAASEKPVVVHCASGNRVGALFAMKAYHVDGSSSAEALAVGKHAGLTRLEPVIRERLGLPEES